MTKKKSLLLLAIALTFALACLLLTACAPKHKITWQIDENVTVTAFDGEKADKEFRTLPKSLKDGEALVFKVTPKTGYEVDEVTLSNKTDGDKKIPAKNGRYTLNFKEDSTVKVTARKSVKSLAVTQNPTRLTYVAGDSVDTTGMVVEATFADDSKGVITDYTLAPATFVGGETAFSVRYGGKSVSVQLDKTVEYKVTLDLKGGALSSSQITALEGMNNFANENGVISFTFLSLPNKITLPAATGDGVHKTGYKFMGWREVETGIVSEIPADATTSYHLSADWAYHVWDATQIAFENKTEGTDSVPYLIVKGVFKADTTKAKLSLYEGNKELEVAGDEFDVSKNGSFETKLDLRKLSAVTDLANDWLDIRISTTVGDGDDAQTQSMEAYYEPSIVDISSTITNSGNRYSFQKWTSDRDEDGGITYLKVFYAPYDYHYDYQVAFSGDNLVISGKVSTQADKGYVGKTVRIDFEQNGKFHVGYGVVAQNGSYTMSFALSEFDVNATAYGHIAIVESQADETTIIYKDVANNGNLLNSECTNVNMTIQNVDIIENSKALKHVSGGKTWYVGYGKWGGLVVFGQNNAR